MDPLPTALAPWRSLGPAILLFAYFLIALGIYVIRWQWRGAYRDRELEGRPTTAITSRWLRLYFAWATRPIFELLLRSGVSARMVTLVSLALAIGAGLALAGGRFALGGWLFLFAGIFDFFDGKLARARKQQSSRGNAMDSVLDRYADAAVLAGLAWFYRETWVLGVALAMLIGSQMISYVRAKGESLGIEVKIGAMQRPERVLLLGLALAMSPIFEPYFAKILQGPPYLLAVAGIAILAVATHVTALRRFLFLLSQLDGPLPTDRSGFAASGELPTDAAPAAAPAGSAAPAESDPAGSAAPAESDPAAEPAPTEPPAPPAGPTSLPGGEPVRGPAADVARRWLPPRGRDARESDAELEERGDYRQDDGGSDGSGEGDGAQNAEAGTPRASCQGSRAR